jgi:hypothetical protein
MPFPAVVDLADIAAGRGGFKIVGENGGDYAGGSVSAAGDVNGDGIDDLIVGAPRNDSGGPAAGAAYVVFGRTGGFASPVDLADIATGSGGFKIQGENVEDWAGYSVSAAGDVNGDRIDDLIVGAPLNDSGGTTAGAAYVVFGRIGGSATPLDLDTIAAGSGGFKIQSESAYAHTGASVSAAGDVNGDGIDDLLVGARGEYQPAPDYGYTRFASTAYVVFGRADGFISPVDLADVAAGNGGFEIHLEIAYAHLSVSAAGDVNGDGFDDVIVGTYSANDSTAFLSPTYVVFGRDGGLTSPIDIDDIAAGDGGFKVIPEELGTGYSVSGTSDVNRDGLADLIIGDSRGWRASYSGYGGGAAYVVFGRTDGFISPVDLADIAAGSGGFKILGENAGDQAGSSVSAAGDVNGDGIDDLIVGALYNDNDSDGYSAGAAYVVFGQAEGLTSPIDLGDIAAGRGGFKIEGENAGDGAGISVSAAGDVNGDGIDDLIVGAFRNNSGAAAGAAYVIFGRRDLFTDNDDTRDLNEFDLDTFTRAQATHALAGDDVVILSETQNLRLLFTGNAGDDSITGSSAGDRIRGDAGSDTLLGRGGDDRLWGTEDGDVLDGGGGDDELNGGNDRDVLRGGSGDDALFARGGDDRTFGGSGHDLVHGGAGHDFVFGGSGDDTLIGGADGDRLDGGSGDDVFRFDFVSHSRAGAVDRIDDLGQGDLIDLSRIDAVSGGADNAFEFIGGGGFTAAGQLRVFVAGGSTFLEGNTPGSGGGELLLQLSGVQRIDAGDLVL